MSFKNRRIYFFDFPEWIPRNSTGVSYPSDSNGLTLFVGSMGVSSLTSSINVFLIVVKNFITVCSRDKPQFLFRHKILHHGPLLLTHTHCNCGLPTYRLYCSESYRLWFGYRAFPSHPENESAHRQIQLSLDNLHPVPSA